jgi:hypothetical protein
LVRGLPWAPRGRAVQSSVAKCIRLRALVSTSVAAPREDAQLRRLGVRTGAVFWNSRKEER